MTLLKNYFKLAFRTLLSSRLVSTINIFGLSVAIGCSIVIFLFLQNHWTMDDFHLNGERIFMVEHVVETNGQEQVWGTSPMPLGPALASDYPQVERAVRVELQGCKVYLEDQMFEELVYFADPGYFDMFTFPLKAGNTEALNEPNSMVLSHELANKYFKGGEAVGKDIVVVFANQARKVLTVKAVAEPFPENIGFNFTILTGFNTLKALELDAQLDWKRFTRGTFVQLRQTEDVRLLSANMQKYVSLHNAVNKELQIKSFIFDNLRHPKAGAHRVYRRPAEAVHPLVTVMFSLVALLMMALSCFNYINISLGLVAKRVKEIGVRKVIGGRRRQLIAQFLSENLLLCFLALLLGLALAEGLFIPILNSIMVVKTSLSFFGNPLLWVFLIGLLAFTGVSSGAYPAFYLSSFQPTAIFRGRRLLRKKGVLPRILLAIQFVLAFSTVIIGVLLLAAGNYWEALPWGYQPDQALVVRLDHGDQFPLLRNEAERSPYVSNVAGAANHIGESLSRDDIFIEHEKHEIVRFDVGAGYFEAIGLHLAAGRFFEPNRRHEDADAVVVNKTFVAERQWAEPIGQTLRSEGQSYRIIGVVEDFKLIGSGATRPVVFFLAEEREFGYLLMRHPAGAGGRLENFMKSTWRGLFPEIPFSFFRQNNVFENFYRSYDNVAQVFSYVAGLALVIACLGLLGLASQNYASQVKEISIRKVLGASIPDIAFVANRVFLFVLVIASLVATGVCYSGVQLLLRLAEEFTGAMKLGVAPYLVGNFLVFLTAGIAISGQLYKLARVTPAETLRNE